jgi:hypothetical protein
MKIAVEVVYALPERQWTVRLELPAGATVRDALLAAQARGMFAQADWTSAGVGIWGRAVPLDRPLRDEDRVEIYRLLQVDPKTARRQRAARRAKG